MTREEAIDKLQWLWNEVYNEDSDGSDYAEAIDMAIEALSEPKLYTHEEVWENDDFISRAEAIKELRKRVEIDDKMTYIIDADWAISAIEDLPSAEVVSIEEVWANVQPLKDKILELEEKLYLQNEIVRCKDCRHHGMRNCPVWGDDTTEDYMWCYYGERKEK